MSKFKILITLGKPSGYLRFGYRHLNLREKIHLSGEYVVDGEEWSHKHFVSRAEATKAYHALIAKLEDKANKAQETLNALVENGHIVEVEDDN